MDIDFVVTWVDMNDPVWKKDFAKAKGIIDNSRNQFSEARFRDYGFLKYWFRGVEKFAPWVRRIHFVTCGQRPEWLDTSNPRLHLVSHRDYIPEKYLPTFNSTVLEFYLDRIPGLSERFVYFNDDFYLTSPTGPDRFFAEDGLRPWVHRHDPHPVPLQERRHLVDGAVRRVGEPHERPRLFS